MKWHFYSLEKKSAKNPDFKILYQKQITLDENKKMEKNQIRTKCLKHLTLFITYHILECFYVNKPGQVRVVRDASAKYQEISY